MASNVGKKFEEDIKKSIPDYCLTIRIPDPPQSFTKRSDTRFSVKNPFDFIVFDSKAGVLYCFELKTTKYKSMSFEDINSDEEQNKMIHKHQIIGLLKCSNYDNVKPGFIFNFRDEKNDEQRTYFQDVVSFNDMCKKIDKFSFNELDLLTNNAIKISGNKKRTRYFWNIDEFLKS